MDDRGVMITIGGIEYELLLTTRATKEIAKRYGGLEELGEKMTNAKNFEAMINEVSYLITLLCNQSIMVENYKNPTAKRELLTEEIVEILTTPAELKTYSEALTEALKKGTEQFIKSESNPKNTESEQA